MERLKTRPDFLRAAKGVRRVAPSVTLELCRTPETAAKPEAVRVGFTASPEDRRRGRAQPRQKAAEGRRCGAPSPLWPGGQ